MKSFDIDRVVFAHQLQGFLVVEVALLVGEVLVGFGEQDHRLATAFTARLPAVHSALTEAEGAPALAIVARVVDVLAIGPRGKRLQAQIYPGLLASEWERFRWHLRAGDTGIPAIGFSTDGDRLGRAL